MRKHVYRNSHGVEIHIAVPWEASTGLTPPSSIQFGYVSSPTDAKFVYVWTEPQYAVVGSRPSSLVAAMAAEREAPSDATEVFRALTEKQLRRSNLKGREETP
jgi:hypothetical protein